MAERLTIVPVHPAGDGAWSWHLLGNELRERGHDMVAIDLRADDIRPACGTTPNGAQ
jgi:hypothetical protein